MKIENIFKILFSLIIALFLVSTTINAQWYDPGKVNKKAYAVYETAYQNAVDQNYVGAIENIHKAISIDPKFVEAYLSLAGIYADLKKYDSSTINFAKALQLDSVYSKTYLLPYSISLAGVGRFGEALTAVTEFLNNPQLNPQSIQAGKYRKSVYEFAIDYQKKHHANNYVFARKNLGDSVNKMHWNITHR